MDSSMRFTFAVSLALLLLAAPTWAEDTPPYVVGDVIDAIALEDQHGDPGAVDASTRVVLFSRDMDGGDLLKEALAEVSADTLATRGAVYVSDISGMPAFVARMMAVPAMRRRPYDMLLDRDGDVTTRLPDAEGKATLIHLDGLRIERIEHAGNADGVLAGLGLAADDSPGE